MQRAAVQGSGAAGTRRQSGRPGCCGWTLRVCRWVQKGWRGVIVFQEMLRTVTVFQVFQEMWRRVRHQSVRLYGGVKNGSDGSASVSN